MVQRRHEGSPQRGRAWCAAVAAAYGVGVLAVVLERETRVTSYLVAAPPLQVIGLGAGLALLAVGAVATVMDRRGSRGPVALLIAVAWLAPAWFSWENGPAVIRSLAAVISPMLVPLLVHVAFLARSGSVGGTARRWVAAAYGLVGGAVLARALVYDPHRSRHCWVDCGPDANVFLLATHMDLAAALTTAVQVLTVVLAGVVVAATIREATVVRTGRGMVALVAGAAAVALVAEAAYAVVLLQDPLERFQGEAGSFLFLVRSFALGALAVGIAWASGVAVVARVRTARLARELADAPSTGKLHERLSRSLGDDSLEVYYWSTPARQYIDADGRPFHRSRDDRRSVTRFVRGNEPLAAVLHEHERVAARALEEELGSAVRLVLDNERLRAQWLADARKLRLSRARIVASGDERRRSLERDLHDGAQQRLIAAGYELRLGQAEAHANGDDLGAEKLAHVAEETAAVLAELRQFAHGVFPAILDEAGLDEALLSLAEDACAPVEVDCRIHGRRPPSIERAVYAVARAATEASADGDAPVTLTVMEAEGTVVVEATGVGTIDSVQLADRVGAVGGTFHLHGGRLRAVLP